MVTLNNATVCTCQRFEQQAARTPDAVALSCGERWLTYAQLNARANQLAHVLRRRGVGPDTQVGVALSRSPEMVVGLLAVWKAGGAYVPLDPTYPLERLTFMTNDAGLRLVLVDSHSRNLLAGTSADMLGLDGAWQEFADEATDNPAPMATAAHLAYVMYTSGSTGQPKGAMIEHGGLANYLHWAIGAYGFRFGGVVPVHSSISFDLTVTSLYPPLLVGGQVELLPEDVGAESLLAALRLGKDYDVLKITPAHLELLRQQLQPEEMAHLCRTCVIGGENLLADSLRDWRRHAPATRFFNEYGPTETVVGCCVHEVLPGDADSGVVPIGRPIDNTTLYVLDDDLRPLPPGVTGELYIGGAGVARGYLNRPQLSAERFVADPMGGGRKEGLDGRLYKTGDLGRCRPDGRFECQGRTDSQVKVRGFRIELGEVEAALAAHGQVQSCAVLAPEVAPGERQLVAYVVPASGLPLTASALRKFLAGRLPAFMVPTQFRLVDAMPLTSNGKVDRHALARLASERAATDEEMPLSSGLPRTPVEERLVTIWRKLLNLGQIGVHDDLFALGARSLLAARAVTQMRAAFDVDLQLRHLFEQPTIAGLATVIDGLAWLTRARAVNTRDAQPRVLEEVEL